MAGCSVRERRATAARCGALSRCFVFCFRFGFAEVAKFEVSSVADCALEPGLGPLATLLFRKPFHWVPFSAFMAVSQRGIIVKFQFPLLLIHTPTKNGLKQREKNQVRKERKVGKKKNMCVYIRSNYSLYLS